MAHQAELPRQALLAERRAEPPVEQWVALPAVAARAQTRRMDKWQRRGSHREAWVALRELPVAWGALQAVPLVALQAEPLALQADPVV